MSYASSVAPLPMQFSEEPTTGVRVAIRNEAEIADVAEYLPLVRRIALRMHRKLPPSVQLDDLVAAGCVGLLDALRRFDGDRSEKFEWYARVRVRGAILDELRTLDWLSRRQRATVKADAEAGKGWAAVIIGFDDLPEQQRVPTSSFAASPADLAEQSSDSDALAHAVSRLPEREGKIVSMHYYQGHAFKDIAMTLKVSEPRISQLHARAVKMLKGLMDTSEDCCA